MIRTKNRYSPVSNNCFSNWNKDYSIVIGNTGYDDLQLAKKAENKVRILCEIVPKYDFPEKETSFFYNIDSKKEVFKSNLYDLTDKSKLVSSFEIKIIDSPLEIEDFSYKKDFEIEDSLKPIELYRSESEEPEKPSYFDYMVFKSKARYFCGKYFSGIKLSEIKPVLYSIYLRTDSDFSLSLIDSTKFFEDNNIIADESLRKSKLTSFYDEIIEGKLVIKTKDGLEYKSFDATKETVVSNRFFMEVKIVGG